MGDDHEKRTPSSSADPGSKDPAIAADDGEIKLTGSTSLGVLRMEALSKHITLTDRIFMFIGVFIIAYAYGLDGGVRFNFQASATASYAQHSLLSVVTVIRSVIAAAAQPTAAKIADVFGRTELVFVSIVFYVVGTVVEAASNNVQTFVGGAILYQIGYTAVILLVEVIIADVTTLRSRLFFSYIPALPFLINTWVSGNITQEVLTKSTWQWGIGMWAIIYPACSLPLLLSLYIVSRRAQRHMDLEKYKTPFQAYGFRRLATALFWQLDVIGIILLIGVFTMILVPFTIAGGNSTTWQQARIIAPLVIGLFFIPAFIFWELKAPHPMVPFHLLKDRGVWGALGIAVTLNTAWYLQGNYLWTVLQVAFNQSYLSATRIAAIYSFTSVITGVIAGIVVYFVRRLKPFIVFGTVLFMVAFGLLIRYRGGVGSAQYSGIIGAEICLGIAGGLFPYPAQASIQAATRHEHVAVITGLYLASYNVGSAFGNTISGAIWSQTLPGELTANLAAVSNNSTLSTAAYGDPFSFILAYPVGTPERDAVITAYNTTARYLMITGICLCVPLIIFGLCTRNPRLTDTQSLPGAEGVVEGDSEATQAFEDQVEKKSTWQALREKLGR